MYKLIFFALAILTLSGCATTHPQQAQLNCQAPNWHTLGVQDGKDGRYPYEIARYQRRCPTIVLTDTIRAEWEAGRQQGLIQYCTKSNAYALGERGHSLKQVCPEDGLLEIQQSHALGYQQYYQRHRLYNDWSWNPIGAWGAPFYSPDYWW